VVVKEKFENARYKIKREERDPWLCYLSGEAINTLEIIPIINF
jgi:hypothetical protein